MSDTGQSKGYRIAFGLLVILILYNIGSGLFVKKLGIPGIFEIEFADKPATQATQPTQTPLQTQLQSQENAEQQKQPQTTTQSIPNTELQQVNPSQFVLPPALPASTCPRVSGMFWLPYPNVWYGPFYGYALMLNSSGGFYVWDPYYQSAIQYPDPFQQIQRSSWLRLQNSPFNVCVEGSTGQVFGQYSP